MGHKFSSQRSTRTVKRSTQFLEPDMKPTFATGTNVVVPKANLSVDKKTAITGPYKVFLNVYDLHKSNSYLYPLGTGFYHSGKQLSNTISLSPY